MKHEQLCAMDYGNGLVLSGTARSVDGIVAQLGKDTMELRSALRAVQEEIHTALDRATPRQTKLRLQRIQDIIDALPEGWAKPLDAP